ncbi:MAG: cupin domain-containing protein [Candidatus Lokiarchaeota archaeon]|nr:cupin domain-containing protein [Candidatus Lokiarchaeota archaeon]
MKLIKEIEKIEEDRGGYTRKVLLEQKNAIRSTWVALVTIPPSGKAQAHFHENVTEFFYFLGAATIGINNKQYDVDTGDLVIVDPGEAHWVKSGETSLQIVVFKFPNIPEDKTLVE